MKMRGPILASCALALLAACMHREPDAAPAPHEPEAQPSGRLDVSAAVRRNLGITFATVEERDVARTLRLPGRFELLPSARREYRALIPGQVEILVGQFDAVDEGTPLYRLDSAAWRSLQESIATVDAAIAQAEARLASLAPLGEAHRGHEEGLAAQVAVWEERLADLEALREAGGGSAREISAARGALAEAEAGLAEVREKDAELALRGRELEAELSGARVRRSLLLESAAAVSGRTVEELDAVRPDDPAGRPGWRDLDVLVTRARAPGIVESIAVGNGSAVAESELILTSVEPRTLRFVAKAPQSDLGVLRDGLAGRITPPEGLRAVAEGDMTGALKVAFGARPDERTIDVMVTPEALASWARAGVSAYLDITLDGGGGSELAVPRACVVRDGLVPIVFRRDPKDPDAVTRVEADLGPDDGRWVVLRSGVREGDEIVLDGASQLALALGAAAPRGGHFHSDGTFHEGED